MLWSVRDSETVGAIALSLFMGVSNYQTESKGDGENRDGERRRHGEWRGQERELSLRKREEIESD